MSQVAAPQVVPLRVPAAGVAPAGSGEPAPDRALRPRRDLRSTPGEVVVRGGFARPCPALSARRGALPGGLEVRKRGRYVVPGRGLPVPPDTDGASSAVPAVAAEWCWRSRSAPLAPEGS